MNKDFSYYIMTYFSKYLPNQTGYSNNTIRSYRDTFIILLRYFNNVLKIQSKNISFDKFTKKIIEDFLLWLETEQKCSISTRNQRLMAIHSFFKYLSNETLDYFGLCTEIIKIKIKKAPIKMVSYLTIEQVKALLSKPNTHTVSGLRDLSLLTLLYDCGARVQELCDLKIENLNLDERPTVKITGKGCKTRIVPISFQARDILKKYIKDKNELDYVFTNRNRTKLTRFGINFILKKYVNQLSLNINDKITPHSLRHSKAMHMLENGVNLIYIRDFLGHTTVMTTEIYAKANPEIKRKHIEETNNKILDNTHSFTNKEKQSLDEWLKSNV